MESRGMRIVSMCRKNEEYNINDSPSISPVPSLPEEVKEIFDSLSTDDEYLPSDSDSVNSDVPISSMQQSCSLEQEKISETFKVRKQRKSVKGKTRSKKLERKLKRNHGEEYITESGITKKARICQPLGSCRMKCKEKFKNEDREIIFKEYWGSGSYEKRVQFITSMIKKQKKASCIEKKTQRKTKNRQFSHTYHLRIDGIEHKICKECFRKTLGETNKFLELCSLKISSSCSGIYPGDLRGIHPPKNKYTDDDIKKVTDFILKVPLYQSHYSRRDSSKKYLPPYYTIAKLYDQYLTEPDHIDIKRTKFEEIFHTMNIGIKKPSKDTCGKCDKLKMKINLSTSAEEKAKFQDELDLHLKEADDYYKSKSEDKRLSKNDRSKKTITFDLQQCLPTPYLSSGVTFYLRQLWTFNLTVHDCDVEQAHCFMWHEAVAGRGANQIASCLYQFLNSLPNSVEEVTLYSDSCTGQNKNAHIVSMYFCILRSHPTLKIIKHKFLVPGHTHMECDGDHALIEKTKKRTEAPIHHPRDWYQLVRCTGKKHPFKVVEMDQSKFFDFAKLLKSELQIKKKDESGNQFYWRNVRELKVDKNNLGIMFFKTSIDENFKSVSFRKRGPLPKFDLQLQYAGPVPISDKKKANLLQLLPYISDVFWDFYRTLPTNNNENEIHPDIVSSDDEENI